MMNSFGRQQLKFILLAFMLIFNVVSAETSTIFPPSSSAEDDGFGCGLDGYEAHCVLDIMDEHIDATAIVNHCHIPLDITFRVIYRYGNGTDQRWQYTFVTTNQNERVLIPGLMLPPQPHALVYLFVRVPQPIFDQHNSSIAAVEASFVAMLADNEWEEAEFLNEAVVIDSTDDCYPNRVADPLLYVLGGSILGVLLVGCLIGILIWCYRKSKLALDELALVSSLETGLPGAQPYQIGSNMENQSNNNISKENEKKNGTSESNPPVDTKRSLPQSFKFGRLREEPVEEKREKVVQKLKDKAVVIGNPVLVDEEFNKMALDSESNSPISVEDVGDTFQNLNSVHKFERDGTVSRSKIRSKKTEKLPEIIPQIKNSHPLQPSDDIDLTAIGSTHNGARPKQKIKTSNSQENLESV